MPKPVSGNKPVAAPPSPNKGPAAPALTQGKGTAKSAGKLVASPSNATSIENRNITSSDVSSLKYIEGAILKGMEPAIKEMQSSVDAIKKIKHGNHFFKTEIQTLESLVAIFTINHENPKTKVKPEGQMLKLAETLEKFLPENLKNKPIQRGSQETLKSNIDELKTALKSIQDNQLTAKAQREAIQKVFKCFSNIQLVIGESIKEIAQKDKKASEVKKENKDEMKDLLNKRVLQGACFGAFLGAINYLLIQASIITAGPTMGIGPVFALFLGVGINTAVFCIEYTLRDIHTRELPRVEEKMQPLIKALGTAFQNAGEAIEEEFINWAAEVRLAPKANG